tara:strand:+ start:6800 stop:8272 length:1473 start_codon:yes stop_codon:yes gene_type:complete
MAITCTLQGVDITEYVDYRTVAITDTMEATGDTMQFDLYMTADNVFGLPVIPACGNEIILTDDVTKEFAGTVTKVSRTLGEADRTVRYQCAAIDYTYMLDRRYVNGIFNTKRVSDGANDSMVKDILEHLKAAADGDTTGGDHYYNQFVANIDAPYMAEGGPVVQRQVYQRILPSQVLGDLSENSGMIWWVDFDKRINFRTTTSMYATFLPVVTLSDGSGVNGIYVEENMTDFYDLTVEDATDGIGTKAIIKDAVIQSSSSAIDNFKVSAEQATNGASFHLDRRPFSELSIVSIVNTTQGYTATQKLEDVFRERSDTSASADGGTFFCFIYLGKQGSNDVAYVRFAPDALTDGDEIVISYKYYTNDEHENIDVDQVEVQALATGGDGFHEFVFSKRSEIAVADVTDLDIVADMLLSRKSKTLRRGSFTSLTKGWQAGQIFEIKWDRENIEEAVWVIVVNKTILTPADDPTLSDNIIQTDINFANIPRGLRL